MHQSIVTTSPSPGEGLGIAGKMCRISAFASSPEFCFLGEKVGNTAVHSNLKHNRLRGQIALVLPNVCPCSVGLVVPAIPRSWGGGLHGYK